MSEILKILEGKKEEKEKKPTKINKIERIERTTKKQAKKTSKKTKTRKIYTKDELRLIAMKTIVQYKSKYGKVLRKLPKSWGGTRKDGGGWSGAWLVLLEILAKGIEEEMEE